MRPWRRLHSPDLIAQVEPTAGFGTWTVSAWHVSTPHEAVRYPSPFQLLTEAQRMADALTTERFGHTCSGQCGHWLARAG